jgi:hypothetical protein
MEETGFPFPFYLFLRLCLCINKKRWDGDGESEEGVGGSYLEHERDTIIETRLASTPILWEVLFLFYEHSLICFLVLFFIVRLLFFFFRSNRCCIGTVLRH